LGNVPEAWQTHSSKTDSSLGKRARKRLESVSQIGSRTWRVAGSTKLGDSYGEYIVHLPDGATKYDCTCYHNDYGQIRQRRMCSHALAVSIWRKENRNKPRQVIVDDLPEGLNVAKISPPEPPDQEKWVEVNVEPGGDDAAGAVHGEPFNPDEPISVDDPRLGAPALPAKFTEFRPHQWRAILEIKEHLDNGVKVVMLSAPTGSGKTLIGEGVKRLMPGRKVYACTTKSLQDQIAHDFSYANVIKGRSNYPTQLRPDLTAEDCTGSSNNNYECDWCPNYHECGYQVAKAQADVSPLPVLNIAYYLAETTASRGSRFINRSLVIVDEADTLEEQLMSSIEVVISARLRQSLGVYALPKKTVPSDWVKWFEYEIIPAINRRIKQLKSESRTLMGTDTKKVREMKRLDSLLKRIRPMLRELPEGKRVIEEGWIMTGYEGSRDDQATVRFKPVKVDELAKDALWNRGQQFLLMSATLISPEQMAEDLGLEDDEWEVVHVNSTFPPERRPVFVDAVTSMTAKTKDTAWPAMAEAVSNVIDENPGVRILVHTVSYQLTQYLKDNIVSGTRWGDRIISYSDARDRERVLAKFLSIEDAVLLAPSFERGIDLPEEDCQVIIIAKVPYPYLGDKQISARMRTRGGQTWYAVQTIRAIAQMTGRGMRSANDWCDTYILDAQFKRLYKDHRTLFPKWWRESVVLSRTNPKYRPLVDAMKERKESRA